MNPKRQSPGRQQGLTLIEILLVLALGVIVTGAVLSLFTQMIQTRSHIERTGQKTEAGRYAIDLLTTQMRLAGYYGEFIPASIDTVLNQLCDGAAVRTNDLGAGPAWNPAAALPAAVLGFSDAGVAATPCIDLSDHVAGTDVLVAWRADTQDPWTARKRLYYVADCDDCGTPDGIPTLKEMTLSAGDVAWSAPVSMVPGVEQLRIVYGFDRVVDPGTGAVTLDGVVDNYRRLPNPVAVAGEGWPDALAARVFVLVRDLQTTNGHVDTATYVLDDPATPFDPPNDAFKRRVFTGTTVFNNVIGRREQ